MCGVRARTDAAFALALVGALWSAACGGALAEPETTRQPLDDFREIPYPPPAALTEAVPGAPAATDAVWVDGEWVFHGKSFVWQRGGWVKPAPGARFARWRTFYTRDGRLQLAPGTWYSQSGARLEPPVVLVPARTPINEMTSEAQTAR